MEGGIRNCTAVVTAGLLALGCGSYEAGGTGPDPAPGGDGEATRLQIIGGDDQNGKTGVRLEKPLVVRVTDANDAGVSGVEVAWAVAEGGGSVSAASTTTDSNGEASVRFTPGPTLGPSGITASVEGLDGSTVSFDVQTTVLLIRIQQVAFVTPGDGDDAATISVGDTIEWLNDESQAAPPGSQLHTVTSVAAPSGGDTFASGELLPGERFRFAPQVTGTWRYNCELHPVQMEGATITVQ